MALFTGAGAQTGIARLTARFCDQGDDPFQDRHGILA
jgi:hypothetical protein